MRWAAVWTILQVVTQGSGLLPSYARGALDHRGEQKKILDVQGVSWLNLEVVGIFLSISPGPGSGRMSSTDEITRVYNEVDGESYEHPALSLPRPPVCPKVGGWAGSMG